MKKKIFLFCFLFFLQGGFFAQQHQLDSLNQIISTSKNDTEKVKTMISLAESYAYSNPDTMAFICGKAVTYIDQSAKHSDEENRKLMSLKIAALNDIGYTFSEVGKSEKAMEKFNLALDIGMESGDSTDLVEVLINRGIVFRRQGNLPMALDDYMRAEKIAELSGNKEALGPLINNISRVYMDMGDTANAMASLEKSIALGKEMKDYHSLETALNNLGILYANSGDNSKAIQYYNEAIDVNKKTGDRDQYAFILAQLATSYFSTGKKQESLLMYERSVAILDSLNSKLSLSSVLLSLGQAQFNLEMYDDAEKSVQRAFDISKELNSKYNLYSAAHLLYEIYSKTNRKDKALEMLEIYSAMKDSTLTDKSRRDMFKKQFQFEYDKKTALAKAEQEKEALAHRITTIAISSGLLLVLIFSAFLFNRFRVTQKQKRLIEEQKLIVDIKNKEVLDSIHYAKRIQEALLPNEKYIERELNKLKEKKS